MIEPTDVDIGRKVIFTPQHVDSLDDPACEQGVITSFNEHYVHVRFGDQASVPKQRIDLFWVLQTGATP